MSDEGSNADGDDVGRFLLHSPLPEPDHMPAVPEDAPVATHVVVGTQHVPADDHALLPAPPMTLDPAPETGFHHAPGSVDAVERHHAVTTMEIQRPQMLQAPDADQAYGFPEAPAPPLAAASPGLDDALSLFEGCLEDPVGRALYQQFMSGEDDLADVDVGGDATGDAAAAATGVDDALPSFEDMSHGAPASQPLDDQFMRNDGRDDGLAAIFRGPDVGNASGGAAVELDDVHTVFVPFVPGQQDCTNCHTVWESLHESANHELHLVLHGTGHGNADDQTTTSEQMYLDLEQRTPDWVPAFIATLVEALSDDSSGPLKHSCSTSCAAASTSSSTTPPLDDDKPRPLELDMLKQILNAPATNEETVAVPQTDPDQAPHQPIIQQDVVENLQDDDMFDGTSWLGLPPTPDSSDDISVQDGESIAAEYYSLLAEQRKRLSSMSMADVINLLHLSREDAAKQLKISPSSLQRLCSKNNFGRWPGRRIGALNSQIEKLEQAALTNVGTARLLEIKEKLDKLKDERAKIYDSFVKLIRENEMKKGAGSSGSK